MKNFLFSFLVCSSLFVQAQINSNSFDDRKYVEVKGSAEMEVIPNEIFLSITLQEEKDGMKRSVEEQENVLISKLKKLEIDVKNLKLANVGSYTHWDKKNSTSYKQKTFELKLTDAGKASEVMYHLNVLEVYRMYVSKTDHSDIQKFRKQVKIDAVIAAKNKAAYLLEAVNEEVGEVIYIIEQDNNYFGGYSNTVANYRTEESYTPNNDVEFQPITLKYIILARFEIK